MFKPFTCYWNLFQWWRNMFVRWQSSTFCKQYKKV
jgi:hypothetical protein